MTESCTNITTIPKKTWISQLNQNINTIPGYFHVGMILGSILAMVFKETALFCVGSMIFMGMDWGFVGYLKFK